MSEASEREALLSCPFCRRIDFLGVDPGERGFLCIKCRGCGCADPSNRAETEAEAIARWNHRAPTSEPAPVAAEPVGPNREAAIKALNERYAARSYGQHAGFLGAPDTVDLVLRAALEPAPVAAEPRTSPCSTDPKARHRFNRDASHSARRYVCDCEGWKSS